MSEEVHPLASASPEIVDSRPDYTPEQDEVIRRVHTHLASLIPELGKDYSVSFRFPYPDDPTRADVTFKGLTRIGQAWISGVQEYFNQ